MSSSVDPHDADTLMLGNQALLAQEVGTSPVLQLDDLVQLLRGSGLPDKTIEVLQRRLHTRAVGLQAVKQEHEPPHSLVADTQEMYLGSLLDTPLE